jgi:hypothetical protein
VCFSVRQCGFLPVTVAPTTIERRKLTMRLVVERGGGGGDGSIIGKRQIWSCSGAGRQGRRAGVRPTTEHSAATRGARTTDRTEGYESVWKGLPSPRAPYVPLVTR